MAKKKAATRSRNGAQKTFEADGFAKKLSKKMEGLLEADRDACSEHAHTKTIKDAARQALLDQMEQEGLDEVRCPFREKIIEREIKPTIKIRPIKAVEEGI